MPKAGREPSHEQEERIRGHSQIVLERPVHDQYPIGERRPRGSRERQTIRDPDAVHLEIHGIGHIVDKV